MNKPDQKTDDTYSEAVTEARRAATLKKLLSTPPEPRKSSKDKGDESQEK